MIRINLPPLRERGSDVKTLAEFFVKKYSQSSGIGVEGISKPALKLLMNYTWPGNVRQLESVIERSVLMAESNYHRTGGPAGRDNNSRLAWPEAFLLICRRRGSRSRSWKKG